MKQEKQKTLLPPDKASKNHRRQARRADPRTLLGPSLRERAPVSPESPGVQASFLQAEQMDSEYWLG
jgi:hypothetical protein